MDSPTLPVSAEKNHGDPIDIRVDIVHPTPANVFPTATVVRILTQHEEAIRGIHGHLEGAPINEEMNALRFRIGMVEEENASLRGSIKTIEAIDTITRRQEKRARTVLTWWNGHVRTLGHDAAYVMTWEILKKKLTDKYCPKGEIKKLEIELWNLKVKGNDVGGYTQRFQELALIQAENKRKLDNNHQAQQQLLKKQNVAQAYAVGTGEKKSYGGSKPLCPKCNYHHDGECAPKSDFSVLKNQGNEARGMVYALEGGETNQDLDNMEDNINA
nr:reverse transcriptase domain-containing protein [Tanacetum cinerariifolium]